MTLIVKNINIPFSHLDIIRLDIDRQVLLQVEDSSTCVVTDTRGRDLDRYWEICRGIPQLSTDHRGSRTYRYCVVCTTGNIRGKT